MRIGILTSVHPPMDTRIYYKQARSLARHGHQVYLVAREGGNIEDLRHVAVPTPGSRWARILTCLRILRQAVRLRCDVYHFHDPELLPIGVLIRWLTGALLVYDVHEDVRAQIRSKYWIPGHLRSLVAMLFGVAERFCLGWVNHVVLAADFLATEYHGNDHTVVRNYPIVNVASEREGPRTYSQRPILAYCGVVARIRGGLEMIEVVNLLREQFPDVLLHVIGSFFPDDFEEIVRSRIQELGLEPNVKIHGRLPMDVALLQVHACDIGLALLHPVPSYINIVPTKMLEYMSLGLPVIVSHFPLAKQIVETAKCGIAVDPQAPREVADAVARLNRDTELLREYGNNGRTAILERYSWEAEEKKLLAIYTGWEGTARDKEHSWNNQSASHGNAAEPSQSAGVVATTLCAAGEVGERLRKSATGGEALT